MTFRYASFALCLLVLLAVPARAAEIVLLHSAGDPTLWTRQLTRAIQTGLDKGDRLHQGFLGSPSLGDEHFEDRYDTLLGKWRGLFPAAVILDGETAFAFARKYGDDLFSSAPRIWLGMDRPDPDLLRQCGRCPGIPLDLDVQGTVDLLFALRPDTATVVGIMDGSERTQSLRQAVEEAMEPYLNRAQILFPGHEPGDNQGLTLDGLQSVASSVTGRDAVLFLGFQMDGDGTPLDEDTAVRTLLAHSAAPVYGLVDTWMNEGGMLGGSMVRIEDLARRALTVVERIRAGERTDEMLPEPTPARVVADLTVMARFGMNPAELPSGAVTLNAPKTPTPPAPVVSTGTVMLAAALAVVLILLLVLRRSRARKDT